MQIKFVGVGNAFSQISVGNSNMLITSDSGKIMAFDMGQTFPYIVRDEWGLDFRDIDAVYLSHLHADHASIEQFAFSRYFIPKKDKEMVVKPKLYMIRDLMREGWESVFRGGLESLSGKVMSITDYFDCKPISVNKSFIWENHSFTPVQTVHIRSGYIIKHSYGLAIKKDPKQKIYDAYITSDTMFDRSLNEYYNQSKIIFTDCETLDQRSNVHPNYMDLVTLPIECKNKMWLYHYGKKIESFREDGFLGFVEKGQEFLI